MSTNLTQPCANRHRSQDRLVTILCALVTLLFAAFLGRLLHINLSMGPRLLAIAEQQQEVQSVVPARRGNIFDRRGRLLAGSKLKSSAYADPALVESPAETARTLSPILEMDAGEIEDLVRSSSAPRFCWLKRRLDEANADAIRQMRLPGIDLAEEFERYWPMGSAAAQVLGFVGDEGLGLAGLELQYNALLRGVDGRRSVVRDARRRALREGAGEYVAPVDGGHLVLTIDAVIQSIVEQRVAEQIRLMQAESAVAVVMSPRTGEVMALACLPTFDLNDFRRADPSLWRNRVITDPVEPGSVFKPFAAAGALEAGIIGPQDKIDCHNGLHLFGKRLMHDTSPHGLMTVKEIVVYSSNIGMGIMATQMGNPALHEIITRFGFGAATQVGLLGESPGLTPPLAQWNTYSTTSVPMGHELAVTPMQLITGFCALVNDGVLLRPRVVRARLNAEGNVTKSYDQPEVVRRVLESRWATYMREEVLTGVVLKGGPELDASPYTMCGKTGTAQVPYAHRRGYEPDVYLSSFMAAAPVDDPQIAVLVMIRKPNPAIAHYGRVVAGPAVRDIVRSVLGYLQVPPPLEVAEGRDQL